jgi:hypothetical protein
MTHNMRGLNKGRPRKSTSDERVYGSALALRRSSVSKGGRVSLETGVPTKHLRSQ